MDVVDLLVDEEKEEGQVCFKHSDIGQRVSLDRLIEINTSFSPTTPLPLFTLTDSHSQLPAYTSITN